MEGPEAAAVAYARALREDRLDEANALTAADYRARVSAEAFRARFADPVKRHERAAAILSALPKMTARVSELDALKEGGGWRVAEVSVGEGPREALSRFIEASEKGDFEAAYRMLSGGWRVRYTPELLARDFAAEPLSKERLSRARAALSAEVVWAGDEARVPLGGGKAVRLTRENGAYRVAALE